MGQALYRDWRPKTFDEVVGQDHITTTLKKAIKNGRISHAYLFTGPRGVGKTSIARILAHEVNGLAYDDESIHLDIIEIDAASNRRIDEIRELRDKVHVSPTSAKYKVYIIDEVHMLTREAFNALLKTLEEPPAHVIFILATTEAHKLPETIVSRTQRFEFKPIGAGSAVEHLAKIAKQEKIDIDRGGLELLAEHGDGSFRDSISLLDQLGTTGSKISEQDVRDFLGLPPATLISELLEALDRGDTGGVLAAMDKLKVGGANPSLAARLLAKTIRQRLIDNPGLTWAAQLLRNLIEVPASFNAEDSLEIALLEACGHIEPAAPKSVALAAAPVVAAVEEQAAAKPEPAAKAVAEKRSQATKTKSATPVSIDEQAWEQIVSRVKDQAASLYTALRLATPEAGDGKLTLVFQFPLHQKKVNQAEHKDLIGRVVAEVTGQNLAVEPVVGPKKAAIKPEAKPNKPAKTINEPLATISNIFGQPEVLES